MKPGKDYLESIRNLRQDIVNKQHNKGAHGLIRSFYQPLPGICAKGLRLNLVFLCVKKAIALLPAYFL